MGNAYTFTEYMLILEILYEEHRKHTEKWLDSIDISHLNLKKLEVRHVCSSDPENIDGFIDEGFLSYIDNYKESLGALYVRISHRLNDEAGLIMGGRIKNDDSILLKLHRKRFEDDGKFPINKYLNDLLGFRLIDSRFEENIIHLPPHIDRLKEQNKRFVHRSREVGEYKGYHVYFMGSGSKYFPMELQIWDTKNERGNLESHKTYKKDYTFWPKIYNRG